MKRLFVAAAALVALAGCVAVPAPYGDAYYYPAPAVGVGIYSAPVVVYGPHYHRYRGYPRYWR